MKLQGLCTEQSFGFIVSPLIQGCNSMLLCASPFPPCCENGIGRYQCDLWSQLPFQALGRALGSFLCRTKIKSIGRKNFFLLVLGIKASLVLLGFTCKFRLEIWLATRGFYDHFVYQPKIQGNSSSPELMDTLGSCETSNQAVQISFDNCAHNQQKLHPWVAHHTLPMKEFILGSLWYIGYRSIFFKSLCRRVQLWSRSFFSQQTTIWWISSR